MGEQLHHDHARGEAQRAGPGDNENVVWFSPELGIFVKQNLRRTAKHPAGPGTRDSELVSHTITR
jgi:hypothetical protein